MFTPTSNMSNVWRGITDNAQWVKQGTSVAIHNGKQTLFWDHIWATEMTLRVAAIHDIPPEIEGATMEEMWEVGQCWRWDLFAHMPTSCNV